MSIPKPPSRYTETPPPNDEKQGRTRNPLLGTPGNEQMKPSRVLEPERISDEDDE